MGGKSKTKDWKSLWGEREGEREYQLSNSNSYCEQLSLWLERFELSLLVTLLLPTMKRRGERGGRERKEIEVKFWLRELSYSVVPVG